MHINVHGKNLNVNERLESYAQQKLSKLDRYLPRIDRIELDLSMEKRKQDADRSVAQLTVRHSRGTILRAEDKSQIDFFAAIDAVIDKMYRQISRYKGKRRRRTGERFEALEPELATAEPLPDDIDDEDDDFDIVRRKQIELAPMSEEEAIDQMELLGHDFFVFYNATSGSINVLYRRKSGDYGLLDPVFGR